LLATRIGLPAERTDSAAAFASKAARSTTASGVSSPLVARSSRFCNAVRSTITPAT
jgi:hypothetical protein